MKKQINMITAGLLALSISTGCQSDPKCCAKSPDLPESGLTLVKNGKAAATILVNAPIADVGIPYREKNAEKLTRDELAGQVLRTAVDDLNYHLKTMSGATLPVAYNSDLKTPVLVLEIKKDAAQDEFFITCTKDKAVIAGKDGFAIAHGIYELLSRQGCDWLHGSVHLHQQAGFCRALPLVSRQRFQEQAQPC